MWRIFGHLGYDEWMRDKARVVMTRREAAGIRNPVSGVRKSPSEDYRVPFSC